MAVVAEAGAWLQRETQLLALPRALIRFQLLGASIPPLAGRQILIQSSGWSADAPVGALNIWNAVRKLRYANSSTNPIVGQAIIQTPRLLYLLMTPEERTAALSALGQSAIEEQFRAASRKYGSSASAAATQPSAAVKPMVAKPSAPIASARVLTAPEKAGYWEALQAHYVTPYDFLRGEVKSDLPGGCRGMPWPPSSLPGFQDDVTGAKSVADLRNVLRRVLDTVLNADELGRFWTALPLYGFATVQDWDEGGYVPANYPGQFKTEEWDGFWENHSDPGEFVRRALGKTVNETQAIVSDLYGALAGRAIYVAKPLEAFRFRDREEVEAFWDSLCDSPRSVREYLAASRSSSSSSSAPATPAPKVPPGLDDLFGEDWPKTCRDRAVRDDFFRGLRLPISPIELQIKLNATYAYAFRKLNPSMAIPRILQTPPLYGRRSAGIAAASAPAPAPASASAPAPASGPAPLTEAPFELDCQDAVYQQEGKSLSKSYNTQFLQMTSQHHDAVKMLRGQQWLPKPNKPDDASLLWDCTRDWLAARVNHIRWGEIRAAGLRTAAALASRPLPPLPGAHAEDLWGGEIHLKTLLDAERRFVKYPQTGWWLERFWATRRPLDAKDQTATAKRAAASIVLANWFRRALLESGGITDAHKIGKALETADRRLSTLLAFGTSTGPELVELQQRWIRFQGPIPDWQTLVNAMNDTLGKANRRRYELPLDPETAVAQARVAGVVSRWRPSFLFSVIDELRRISLNPATFRHDKSKKRYASEHEITVHLRQMIAYSTDLRRLFWATQGNAIYPDQDITQNLTLCNEVMRHWMEDPSFDGSAPELPYVITETVLDSIWNVFGTLYFYYTAVVREVSSMKLPPVDLQKRISESLSAKVFEAKWVQLQPAKHKKRNKRREADRQLGQAIKQENQRVIHRETVYQASRARSKAAAATEEEKQILLAKLEAERKALSEEVINSLTNSLAQLSHTICSLSSEAGSRIKIETVDDWLLFIWNRTQVLTSHKQLLRWLIGYAATTPSLRKFDDNGQPGSSLVLQFQRDVLASIAELGYVPYDPSYEEMACIHTNVSPLPAISLRASTVGRTATPPAAERKVDLPNKRKSEDPMGDALALKYDEKAEWATATLAHLREHPYLWPESLRDCYLYLLQYDQERREVADAPTQRLHFVNTNESLLLLLASGADSLETVGVRVRSIADLLVCGCSITFFTDPIEHIQKYFFWKPDAPEKTSLRYARWMLKEFVEACHQEAASMPGAADPKPSELLAHWRTFITDGIVRLAKPIAPAAPKAKTPSIAPQSVPQPPVATSWADVGFDDPTENVAAEPPAEVVSRPRPTSTITSLSGRELPTIESSSDEEEE